MTPTTRVVIKSSRIKYAILLVASFGFVAGGIFVLKSGGADDAWVGWMSIAFFGAGIPLFVWQLIDSRPRIVIDEKGILDRTLGVGLIPWSEITGAYMKSIQRTNFICLQVRNPQQWLSRLSPIKRAMVSANEALGYTALNLNLSAIAADPEQILELILKTIESRAQSSVKV